jgi:hypothetical protein
LATLLVGVRLFARGGGACRRRRAVEKDLFDALAAGGGQKSGGWIDAGDHHACGLLEIGDGTSGQGLGQAPELPQRLMSQALFRTVAQLAA